MVVLTSFPPPEEGVIHKQEETEAHVPKKGCLGAGTLFIAESRVSWRSTQGDGFSLEYKAISLHAISRDLSAFPKPCLYLMIDADLNEHESSQGNGSDTGEEDEDEDPLSEIRFVPTDPLALEAMYKAMSDCQQLHPDTDQSDEEEDFGGEGHFFTDETGANVLTSQGQQTLERLNAMLSNGTGGPAGDAENAEEQMDDAEQFEDAEMDEPR